MGLIVLSTVLAIVMGSCVWLVIGDRFPLGDETKWPTVNNICIFAVILVLPIYLVIFFLF